MYTNFPLCSCEILTYEGKTELQSLISTFTSEQSELYFWPKTKAQSEDGYFSNIHGILLEECGILYKR